MRTAESCPYREQLAAARPGGHAICRLLGELIGLSATAASQVGIDACVACCQYPLPSAHSVNPVIASMVSIIVERVIASSGLPGCSAAKAARLKQWAVEQLRIEVPVAIEPTPSLPLRARHPCCYLGDEAEIVGSTTPPEIDSGPRFVCHHPDHVTTTVAACHRCRDWADRPKPAPLSLRELLPITAPRHGSPVRRWAVGVRTAHRDPPTLDWSLDSLARAGWTEPRLFADSMVSRAARSSHLPMTVRDTPVGAWPSFYMGLTELLMREPDADAYLMAEDDVLYYDRQNLREYFEQILWHGDEFSLVSLYCSAADTEPRAGWHVRAGQWMRGSLAFIFPPELAKRFVTDSEVLQHRWKGPGGGLAGVSIAVGSWAHRNGVPIYYPCPSLAQHIGDRSTLWPATRAQGDRRADWFMGDLEWA
jgi:hypothetical protein